MTTWSIYARIFAASELPTERQSANLLRLRHDALVIPRINIIQCPLEMPLRVVKGSALLVRLKIGMDELNKAVQVLGRHLVMSITSYSTTLGNAYSLVLLIEIVYISI